MEIDEETRIKLIEGLVDYTFRHPYGKDPKEIEKLLKLPVPYKPTEQNKEEA